MGVQSVDRFLHAIGTDSPSRKSPAALLQPAQESKEHQKVQEQNRQKQKKIRRSGEKGSGEDPKGSGETIDVTDPTIRVGLYPPDGSDAAIKAEDGSKGPFDQDTQDDVHKQVAKMTEFHEQNVLKSYEELDGTKHRGTSAGRSIGELVQTMRDLKTGTQTLSEIRQGVSTEFVKEAQLFDTFRVGAIGLAVNDTTRLSLEQQKAQQQLIDAAKGALNSAGQWISDKRRAQDLGKVSASLQEMYPGKTPAQVWQTLDIDQDKKLTVDELFQAMYNLGRNHLSEQEARKVATETYEHLGRLMGIDNMPQTENVFYHAFSSNEMGSSWVAPHVAPQGLAQSAQTPRSTGQTSPKDSAPLSQKSDAV
jgi:hypothetical protein